MINEPHNFPGPGEQDEPANVPGEAHSGPIPDGEMPTVEVQTDPRRLTQELKAVDLREGESVSDYNPRSRKHRTGQDHDNLRPVHADQATEQRLDHSAHDLQRENAFDSVPDDAGPHSDKY